MVGPWQPKIGEEGVEGFLGAGCCGRDDLVQSPFDEPDVRRAPVSLSNYLRHQHETDFTEVHDHQASKMQPIFYTHP